MVPRVSAITGVDCNVGIPSTSHASTQHITNSHTVVSKSLTGASAPFRSLPTGTTNTSVMSHYPTYAISSVQHTSPKTFQLHKEGDTLTPQSSPPTVYHDIRPSPYTQHLNHPGNQARPRSDNVSQITDALAKVTQLQRLPQAKPDVFTGEETDTRFFIWATAFDALIDSAPVSAQQKL